MRALAAALLAVLARPTAANPPEPAEVTLTRVVRGGMAIADGINAAANQLSTEGTASQPPGTKLGFSDNTRYNDQYWHPVAGGFALNDDAQPTAAILDVFAHPEEYSVGCNAAVKLVLYSAILHHIGSSAFDRWAKAGGLLIDHAPYDGALAGVLTRGLGRSMNDTTFPGMASENCGHSGPCDNMDEDRDESDFVRAQLKPGDAVAVVNLRSTSQAWNQENLVFLGGEKYFGHPLGERTLPSIELFIKSHWDREPENSQIYYGDGYYPNGPPGLVSDLYRLDADKLAKLRS